MVASSPDSRRRRVPSPAGPAFAAVIAGALFAVGAPQAAWAQQQEITLEAASSDFDRRNERLVFREITVQQGDISISANEAESRDLDFSRGTWVFRGDVRVRSPMGDMDSERATVTFAGHRLEKATAEGAPARFSRTMPGPEARLVTGTANRIVYDLARGELELAGQANLRDGVREVSGGRLQYRIAEDRLLASADDDGSERVRIVITPPAEPGEPDETPTSDRPPEGGDAP
jgi:lipopolysaccharide transport protein LptA